jgi:predicted  nucleic acid-binding Zn-ribbon protein
MPHLSNPTLEIYLYCTVGVVLIVLGYLLGKSIAAFGHRRVIAGKEQELFTAQRGFKNLYEQELAAVRTQNADLQEQLKQLTTKVEEYRKKAAGLGGLFNSGGKRADAMYALLLENEALEEALYSQNEKLRQERTDSLKDQLRATSYRRVLMSQLLNDERIKGYVAEIMQDEKRLPAPNAPMTTALPAPQS